MTRILVDCILCVLMVVLLFFHLTSTVVDKEKQELDKIRNSRGVLIKGEYNGQV